MRSRRHLALLLAVFALAGAVEAHHGVPMDMHGMSAAVICLAVLGMAAIVVIAVGGLLALRWPRPMDLEIPSSSPTPARAVPARAGPPIYLRLSAVRR